MLQPILKVLHRFSVYDTIFERCWTSSVHAKALQKYDFTRWIQYGNVILLGIVLMHPL